MLSFAVLHRLKKVGYQIIMTSKAVIMARGMGTRMRRDEESIRLAADQAAAAAAGIKALISVGRPFIEYSLSALADAGIRHVCIVIGPEHLALRHHCKALPLRRLQVSFAIQHEPRGTADAVLAAQEFVANDSFLVVNGDNYYPASALSTLVALDMPGMIGFDRQGLARANLDHDRVRQFAAIQADADGWLKRIVEKPSVEQACKLGRSALVSMNCWRFNSDFFHACQMVAPSERGELELTSAVQIGIDQFGLKWRVLPCCDPVFDLTGRRDIPAITAALASKEVQL